MAFDSNERSNASAKPVALYQFVFGSVSWFYTSYEDEITVNGVTYEPIAISDNGSKMSGTPSDEVMTITCPSSIPVAEMMNGSPPSESIWVYVRRYHHGDDEAPITWPGYVATRKGRDDSSVAVDLRCKMLTAGFSRDGARLTYGRQCPHALYSLDCGVNKDSFAVTVQVEELSGNTVFSSLLAGYPDTYFSNGFFQWSRYAGALERRGIENHVGGKFTVLGTTIGLSVGDYVTLYPGCQRTRSSCIQKFNNLSNYGGVPNLPGSSPFAGDPVF